MDACGDALEQEFVFSVLLAVTRINWKLTVTVFMPLSHVSLICYCGFAHVNDWYGFLEMFEITVHRHACETV